jgi:hypothetical protein
MEPFHSGEPGEAALNGAGQAARRAREAGAPGYRVGAEHVRRWLADERDELDLVAIRTWN